MNLRDTKSLKEIVNDVDYTFNPIHYIGNPPTWVKIMWLIGGAVSVGSLMGVYMLASSQPAYTPPPEPVPIVREGYTVDEGSAWNVLYTYNGASDRISIANLINDLNRIANNRIGEFDYTRAFPDNTEVLLDGWEIDVLKQGMYQKESHVHWVDLKRYINKEIGAYNDFNKLDLGRFYVVDLITSG